MNLSIPDAVAELGVSETRLRKTLHQIAVPTAIEFRKTRTGVRKTTVLPEQALTLLRAHFQAPQTAPHGSALPQACPPVEEAQTAEEMCPYISPSPPPAQAAEAQLLAHVP